MMKQLFKQFRYGEKGFILSELLVNVVAVFSVLTIAAIPNVSNAIGQIETESYEAELHNITTEIMEILVDRAAGVLDEAVVATDDMSTVLSTDAAADDINLDIRTWPDSMPTVR